MIDSPPTLSSRHLLGVSLDVVVAALLGMFITLVLALVAYSLLDVSLGTVFAAVFLASLFAIGMAEVVTNVREWGVVSVVVALASTAPILLGIFDRPGLALAGAQLVLLCLALAGTMIATVRAVSRLTGHAAAAALVVVVGLAWFTWPVWMSPYFDSRVGAFFVDHLLAHQPLFAIGGAYHVMGDWTHAPIAYDHLTNLGQDVMFAPPTHAWAAIASHAVLAGVMGAAAFISRSGQTPVSPQAAAPGSLGQSHPTSQPKKPDQSQRPGRVTGSSWTFEFEQNGF